MIDTSGVCNATHFVFVWLPFVRTLARLMWNLTSRLLLLSIIRSIGLLSLSILLLLRRLLKSQVHWFLGCFRHNGGHCRNYRYSRLSNYFYRLNTLSFVYTWFDTCSLVPWYLYYRRSWFFSLPRILWLLIYRFACRPSRRNRRSCSYHFADACTVLLIVYFGFGVYLLFLRLTSKWSFVSGEQIMCL